MATIQTAGTNNFTWGIGDTYSGVILQSETKSNGAKTKELLDENGDTKALAVYDKHETISLSGLINSADGINLTIGDSFTVNGKTYRCTAIDFSYTNEDVAKVNISGRTYPQIDA